MRGPFPFIIAFAWVALSACDPPGPCDSPSPSTSAALVVGEGVPGRDFKALDAHVPYALVMGEQGLAMLDGLALKATGMVPQALGRTREGWSMRASFATGGEEIALVRSPHMVRDSGDGTGFEVVGIRVIPDPPPLKVWDQDIEIRAEAVGLCGNEASATLVLRASRP